MIDRHPTGFAETYSVMLDDQLLVLARDMESLTVEAQTALRSELRHRGIGETDVKAYLEHISVSEEAAKKYLRELQQRPPIASSLQGVGTTLYGKCAFRADGSYLTTKWIAVLLPLFPICSYRLRDILRGYEVLETTSPNLRQVLRVYTFFWGLVGLMIGSFWLAMDTGANLGVAMVAPALLFVIPWYLRRHARNSMSAHEADDESVAR